MEQELAQLQPPSVPGPSAVQTVLSFVLAPVGLRDGGQLPRLKLSRQAQTVRLRLKLPATAPSPVFVFTVRTGEGQEIATQQIKPLRGHGEVAVSLRAALLKPDDYTVRLSGQTATGEVETIANYAFRVIQE